MTASSNELASAVAELALDNEESVSRLVTSTLSAAGGQLESSVEKEPSTHRFEYVEAERTDSGKEHVRFWLEYETADGTVLRPSEIVLIRDPLTVILRIASRQHDVRYSSSNVHLRHGDIEWARAIFVAFAPSGGKR